MLPVPSSVNHYKSAHKRFLKPAIENFFEVEFPKSFGPSTRSLIADEIIKIFEANNRDISTIKPGQVLWNAVHKNTRADSKKMKLVPVVLTLINDNDITNLENGIRRREHKQNLIARILREAYQQNALLSMRDVGLLLSISDSNASWTRKGYEKKHNLELPHPGNLQDMGTCITHKYQIIFKYIVEKKDPLNIAKETNHTIHAVDNYLRNFNRVKTLYLDNKDEKYINTVTNLSIGLINQYISIINQYVKDRKIAI
jgi:hypothetical protein